MIPAELNESVLACIESSLLNKTASCAPGDTLEYLSSAAQRFSLRGSLRLTLGRPPMASPAKLVAVARPDIESRALGALGDALGD